MKKTAVILLFIFCLTVSAKININAFPEKVTLEGQEIFIDKAEIIINKMPTVGPAKSKNYIIVTLAAGDGKKIKAKYTMKAVSFPGCRQNFNGDVKETRGDSCVVRDLPSWAGKGTLVVLKLKDSKGKEHMLRATASVLEVH